MSARRDDQSVFNEPHLRPDAGLPLVCHHCGYDRGGIASSLCPECGQPPHGIEHSPWDEPALRSGSPPESAFTYARWLSEHRAATPISTTWATTILIALSAGPLGLMGALWGAGESRFSALALVLFGPLIEEVSKIMAATYIVEKKPYLFASASQILICCAAGGLAFAIFENLIYLFIYFPRHDPWLWAWRWSVCTALHTGCSLIAGLGLVRSWQQSRTLGSPPDLNLAAPLLITAIVIHGVYNAGAMFLSLAGF